MINVDELVKCRISDGLVRRLRSRLAGRDSEREASEQLIDLHPFGEHLCSILRKEAYFGVRRIDEG